MQYKSKTVGSSHSPKNNAKALSSVNDITAMLYGGESRADEIDYMLYK